MTEMEGENVSDTFPEREVQKTDEELLTDARKRVERLQKKRGGKRFSLKNKNLRVSRGVVYLGHVPHGFYEEQMREFFTQFGQVKRVKVSRSPKTGKSKGYAFVEFAHDEVAKIVAETMNNYLMFERLVKAQYIPPSKVHPKTFPKNWITTEKYPTLLRRKRAMKNQEKEPTAEKLGNHLARIKKRVRQSVKKLTDMGIDYSPQIYDPNPARTRELLTNLKKKKTSELPKQSETTETVPSEVVIVPKTTADPVQEGNKHMDKRIPKAKKTPKENGLKAVKKTAAKSTEKKVAATSTKKKVIAKATEKKVAAKSTEKKVAAKSTEKKVAAKSTEKKVAAKSIEKKVAAKSTEKKVAAKAVATNLKKKGVKLVK